MSHREAARYPMAENGGARSLIDHFAVLADPRQSWKVVYPLPEVLLLVRCGTLAGAEDFVEIRRWGMVNQGFWQRFLPFAEGIPSHDTLNDLVNALDGDLFAACFSKWVASLCESEPDLVAIDGKTSRRTHDKAKERNPLHLVSCWASRLARPSRTRSPRSRCSWSASRSRAPWSPLMRWAARPGSPRRSSGAGPTTCSPSRRTGRTCMARASASSRTQSGSTATRPPTPTTAVSSCAVTPSATTSPS